MIQRLLIFFKSVRSSTSLVPKLKNPSLISILHLKINYFYYKSKIKLLNSLKNIELLIIFGYIIGIFILLGFLIFIFFNLDSFYWFPILANYLINSFFNFLFLFYLFINMNMNTLTLPNSDLDDKSFDDFNSSNLNKNYLFTNEDDSNSSPDRKPIIPKEDESKVDFAKRAYETVIRTEVNYDNKKNYEGQLFTDIDVIQMANEECDKTLFPWTKEEINKLSMDEIRTNAINKGIERAKELIEDQKEVTHFGEEDEE